MTADPEEDALAWGGETDPSHVAGPKPDQPESAPVEQNRDDDGQGDDGTSGVGVGSADAATSVTPGTSSMLLVSFGALAGAYLIYTLGWFISVQRLNAGRAASGDLLTENMFHLYAFLAIASPVVWFAVVFLLTRNSRPLVRLLWLLGGLIAVLPWPFVLGAWL